MFTRATGVIHVIDKVVLVRVEVTEESRLIRSEQHFYIIHCQRPVAHRDI